jgi:predicted peptidase
MKTLIIILLLTSVCCFGQTFKDVNTGFQKARVFNPDTTAEKIPLMLFYHGIDERGDNLNMVWKYGPLYYARYDSLGVKVDYIAAAPQLPAGQSWTGKHVKDMIDFMLKTYPQVDKNQIWIVGVSFAGGAIWGAMTDSTINKSVAAFVPICAIRGNVSKANVISASRVPGWAFHAELDTRVSYSGTKDMVAAVNNLSGYEQIKLTTYWGSTSHAIWAKVFKDPGFLPWLKLQKRPGEKEQVIKQEVINGKTLRIYTPTKTYDVPIQSSSKRMKWKDLDFRKIARSI